MIFNKKLINKIKIMIKIYKNYNNNNKMKLKSLV